MRIAIVTPAPARSKSGNRVTALRWARILSEIGHRVHVIEEYGGQSFDVLIALHATKSHKSIRRFQSEFPGRPLIVALTGTDLYRDLNRNSKTRESLDLASRIVTLQSKAAEALPSRLRQKVRVILQSIASDAFSNAGRAGGGAAERSSGQEFVVSVIGHLRAVKDPFRTALASRRLPRDSRIRVVQVGEAMTPAMAERARREMRLNPRYRWLGERSRRQAHRILAASDAFVLSSRMEGGANVLSEAIVAMVPVLASRIPGSVGLLGEDYPGYFAAGATGELAELMVRAETDPAFLRRLTRWCERLAPQFSPAREKAAWLDLLNEFDGP